MQIYEKPKKNQNKIKILFIYESQSNTTIECNLEDKLEIIFQKYASKIGQKLD